MGFCKCRRRTELWSTKTEAPVCHDCIANKEHKLKYADWLENPVDEPPVCPLSGTTSTLPSSNPRNLLHGGDQLVRGRVPSQHSVEWEPMVPPLEDNSRLAEDIRLKLSRFSWIAPLLEAQKISYDVIERPDQEGVVSRKGKLESGLSNQKKEEGDVLISMERDDDDKKDKKVESVERKSRACCRVDQRPEDDAMKSKIEEELWSHLQHPAKQNSKTKPIIHDKEKEKEKEKVKVKEKVIEKPPASQVPQPTATDPTNSVASSTTTQATAEREVSTTKTTSSTTSSSGSSTTSSSAKSTAENDKDSTQPKKTLFRKEKN